MSTAAGPAAYEWPFVRAGREARQLLRDTGEGLLRAGVPLLGIALTSFAAQHLLTRLAASIAPDNGPLGLAVLVLAITVRLVLLGLGIYVAAGAIRVDGRSVLLAGADLGHAEEGPREGQEGFGGLMKVAIVPMVVLYAAWNQVNWDIHKFMLAFYYEVQDRYDWDQPDKVVNFSNIDFQSGGWKSYIPYAIGIWVLKLVVDRIAERVRHTALDLVVIALECGWIVLAWLVVSPIVGFVGGWLRTRVLWVDWIGGAGRRLGELLHLDLPDLVSRAASWLWQLLVTVSTEIVWPLVWVALVGLLVGWVRADTEISVGRQHARRSVRMLGRVLSSSTAGIREKFYPVVSLARAIWRAGPIPVLVIAVLHALLMWVFGLIRTVVLVKAVPEPMQGPYFYDAWISLVDAALTPVRTCFVVAAFALVLRLVQQRGPANPASPAGPRDDGQGPTTWGSIPPPRRTLNPLASEATGTTTA